MTGAPWAVAKPPQDEGGGPAQGEDDALLNAFDVAGEARLYRSMRSFWHPVMYASELGDEPRQAMLLGEQLVVVRLAGGISCFPDLCVHRGTALSLGWVKDDQLQCAFHGWTYDAEGLCTAIPARFGINIPRRARLHRYAAREQGGLIWVCLGEPLMPIPAFPEFHDPSFRVLTGPVYAWRTSSHRRIENFVDFAHFPWVHEGILGSREHPEVEDHDVWRDGDTLRFGRHGRELLPEQGSTESFASLRFGRDVFAGGVGDLGGPDGDRIEVEYQYVLTMPLTIHFERRFLDGRRYVLMVSASPVGPALTNSYWFQARNYALDVDDDEYLAFEGVVLEQDRPVVESQRPEMLPFDLSAELHIRGADRVSVEYRKWLIELVGQVEEATTSAAPRPR
jgi:vanillate O-demethylase monooxygenase subunit